MTSDGRMAPPASVRNAPEAPKYDPSKATAPATAGKTPDVQLPTEFNLPTELDIATPQVPAGISAPPADKRVEARAGYRCLRRRRAIFFALEKSEVPGQASQLARSTVFFVFSGISLPGDDKTA